jgi:Pregnancy-associated plasma protein-A
MGPRLFLALSLAVLTAAVAAQASPAGAARTLSFGPAYCSQASTDLNGLDRMLASASVARAPGKVMREPELASPNEVQTGAQPDVGPGFAATIPVYFHVVSDGTDGDVSAGTIQQQMIALNFSFGGAYGGVDTGFSFELAAVDRTENATWYNAGPGSKAERDMKKALRQGGADALNVYTTSGNVYLGWSYFPSTYKTRPYLDGIVMDYRSMPGGPYGSDYSLGFTLTHEAGHWLELYHTFQGGCNAKGDYVDDTPAERTPTSGCPEGKDTCSKPGLDPVHNYMDYSFDSCYEEFTGGQAARMQAAYALYRA